MSCIVKACYAGCNGQASVPEPPAKTLMRTVGRRQNRMFLKRSQDLDWTDIFNNNVIFIGQAGVQPKLSRIVQEGDFLEKVGGVVNVRPRPGEQAFYPV